MSELTYTTIKESIVKGDLKPKQSINEIELADLLGISRTPVREALKLLNKEGWVTKDERGKGKLMVSPLSKDEVKNLFFLREYLEALSVIQAMLNSDAKFINKLEEAFTKLKLANQNPKEVVDYGKVFHSLILNQANNPILERMLIDIGERIELYRRLSVSKVVGRTDVAIEEHQAILEAIRDNRKEDAELAMRTHIKSSYQNIILSDEIFNDESQ